MEKANVKKWLNQTNGWQRIYLVFLTFIYVPIVLLLAWGNSPRVLKEHELVTIVSDAVLTKIIDKKIQLVDVDGSIEVPPDASVRLYVNEAHRWHKHRFLVSKDIPDKEYFSLIKSIDDSLRQEYKWREIKVAFHDWIFPATLIALFVYALGYSIGWAMKGFRNKHVQ